MLAWDYGVEMLIFPNDKSYFTEVPSDGKVTALDNLLKFLNWFVSSLLITEPTVFIMNIWSSVRGDF